MFSFLAKLLPPFSAPSTPTQVEGEPPTSLPPSTIRLNNVTLAIPPPLYNVIPRAFRRLERTNYRRLNTPHWITSDSTIRKYRAATKFPLSLRIVRAILSRERLPRRRLIPLPRIGRSVGPKQYRFTVSEFDRLTEEIYELHPKQPKARDSTTDYVAAIAEAMKANRIGDRYTSASEIIEVLRTASREPGYVFLGREWGHVPAELYHTVVGEWKYMTAGEFMYSELKRAFGRVPYIRDCRTHKFIKDVRERIAMTSGWRVGTELLLRILSREGVVGPVSQWFPVLWVDPRGGPFEMPEPYERGREWDGRDEELMSGGKW